jgi:hypothetical protein
MSLDRTLRRRARRERRAADPWPRTERRDERWWVPLMMGVHQTRGPGLMCAAPLLEGTCSWALAPGSPGEVASALGALARHAREEHLAPLVVELLALNAICPLDRESP